MSAGADFDSIPVDGTRCRFRAWAPFDVVPWNVEDARIAWSAAEGQSLDVSLRKSSDAGLGSLLPLRLHLSGDSRAALTLLLFLRCHLTDVELRIGGTRFALGKTVRPWGLACNEPLLPPEPFEHPGLRLLREYFVLPAKFAFVEIPRPAEMAELSQLAAERVELRFRFDAQLPITTHVTRENVRVNCVPVVNVFDTTTDPVSPSLERPEWSLRPAGLPLGHGETYSVSSVHARAEGVAGVLPITAFSDFEATSPGALHGVHWVARSVPAAGRRGNETLLSLGSSAVIPEIEFLSVEIRACNGALPNALGVGDVCVATPSSPAGLPFRNVSAVSTYRPPASGDELRWRTLALTSLSTLPLTRADALQTLLHVLNLHPLVDAQAARAHEQRLAAVSAVAIEGARARQGSSGLVFGSDVRVDIGNAGFDGEGDALIFASVLSRLFAHEASIGTFTRTRVHVLETGRVFSFPALHGDRSFEDR
jgi:type VI secretion system protein ImpG